MLLIAASDGKRTKSEWASTRCVHIGDKQAFRHFKLSSSYVRQPKLKHNNTINTPFEPPPGFTGCRIYEGRYQGGSGGREPSVAFPYLGDEQQMVPGLREAVVDNDAQLVLVVDNFL